MKTIIYKAIKNLRINLKTKIEITWNRRGCKLLMGLFLLISNLLYGQIEIDSCQNKARLNYPLIKQFGLIDQTTEFTLSNANKAFLPQLKVNLIGGVIDGLPSFDLPGVSSSSSSEMQLISVVQINQALWDGGVTKAHKELINTNANIEKAEIDVTLYQIRNRVNHLFFGILLIEEQIEQIRIFNGNLQRKLKQIEIAVQNGTAYKSDLDEIRVELLNAEEKITELSFNKRAYTRVLSVMIGEKLSEEDDFQRPKMELIASGVAMNRPELQVFEERRAMIEAQSRLNKTGLYPKIGLLGFGTFLTPGIEFGSSDVNRVLVGGLSLSWGIGGLYRNSNNKKLDEIGLLRIQNQEDSFLFNTGLEQDQTRIELQKYQELILQSKEIVAIKQRLRKAYEVKYENGISTMNELLDKSNDENIANQKLVLQEIQYLQKLYQYKFNSGN